MNYDVDQRIWSKWKQVRTSVSGRLEKSKGSLSQGDQPGWKCDDCLNGNRTEKKLLYTKSTTKICSIVASRQNILI